MIDTEGRSEDRIHAAIDWCQDHEFWRSVVLSMPKLRVSFDAMRLQAARDQARARNGNGRYAPGAGPSAPLPGPSAEVIL
jgi:hypothetical protein